MTVRYEAVNAMLLNEFLKAHSKVEEQQATITRLESKALASNREGSGNTAIGYQALASNRGYGATAIGAGALHNNYVSYENTATGVDALGSQ